MIFCKKCGYILNNNDLTCPNCGEKIASETINKVEVAVENIKMFSKNDYENIDSSKKTIDNTESINEVSLDNDNNETELDIENVITEKDKINDTFDYDKMYDETFEINKTEIVSPLVSTVNVETPEIEQDYKFCSKCGNKLEKDYLVCPKCGTRQKDKIINRFDVTDSLESSYLDNTVSIDNNKQDKEDFKYCRYCGKKISKDSNICKYCGKNQNTNKANKNNKVAILVIFIVILIILLYFLGILV